MNQVLKWLSGGDLRSDGMSNEVADIVLNNPQLFGDLFEGLSAGDDVIRGRTADALEKVSRERPDLLVDRLHLLMQVSKFDTVPMVKMHIAMIFGNLAVYKEKINQLILALLDLLEDESAFVKSWTISSLCIIGRIYPGERDQIVEKIVPLQKDKSIAIRTRAGKALNLLLNENAPFPKGWIKSRPLQSFGLN